MNSTAQACAVSARLSLRRLPAAGQWLRALNAEVTWQSEFLSLFGRRIEVPRRVAWYGDPDTCYRYSRTDHVAAGWTPTVAKLRDWLQQHTGVRHNFVLLNQYRSGADYMGWHADDEPALCGDVCSVSLGGARRFLLETDTGIRTCIELQHGSVITIPRSWRHCLPKTKRCVKTRINLSFRCVQ